MRIDGPEKYSPEVPVYRIKDQNGKDIIIPAEDLVQEAAVYLEQGGVPPSEQEGMRKYQAERALQRTLEKYNPLIKLDNNLLAQIKKDIPRVLELFGEKEE